MKNRWIYIGLAIVLLVATKSFLCKLILCFLFSGYWYWRFKDHTLIILIILLAIFMIPRNHEFNLNSDIGRIVKIRESYVVIKVDNMSFITYDLKNVNYDDQICFKGTLENIDKNPSRYHFDNQGWLYSENIYYELKIEDYQIIKEGNTLRNHLFSSVDQLDDINLKSFMYRLIFQYKSEDLNYQDDIVNLLGSLGIYLSTSVYLFTLISGFFLYPSVILFIVVILLFILGIYHGFNVIILRLILQKTLFFIKDNDDRLGIMILVLLIINPYFIYSLSFQLSMTWRFLRIFYDKRKKYDLSLISIPLQLLTFYRINIFTVFAFIYLRYYFYFGYLLAIISLLNNRYCMMNLFIKSFDYLTLIIPDLSFTGKPSILWLFGWLLCSIQFLKTRKKKYVVCFLLMILINQYQMIFNPFGELTYINIGQGDCAYLRYPFSNDVLLIDTGSVYNYNRLKTYLNAQGIKKISTLAISHDDSDHSGNVENLFNDYHVLKLVENKSAKLSYKNLKITNLLADRTYENKNDNSLIFLFEINSIKYLFLGDISKEVEYDLINTYPNLQADVIKLAHHGSKTSTSDIMIRNLRPKLVLISCGKNNLYHHPSSETIQRLDNYRIPYLITAESGDISIVLGYFHNLLLTSNNEFAIIK